MMFHFNCFASLLSAVTMAATASAPTHASESRHPIDDTKNDGGPMAATGDRNPFVPSKIAESSNPQLDADKKDMVLLLHPRPIFPGKKEQKVQAGTLRNEDASNTPETISDGKFDRNQTANTSTPFDPSLDLGILDGNRIPNDRSIYHRKLDGLDCNGNHPSIPAEVDFKDLIEVCLDSNSCPYELPIGCWDTFLVTDMSEAFFNKRYFNEDISAWETSSVTNMHMMFRDAREFNQPVDSWNVSSVTDMSRMFASAYDFNQPVDSWDVSSVTSMHMMFGYAREFNQPVDSWDVSSVNRMNWMFASAFDFNQPVDSWDVSSVTTMLSMFYGAKEFNQCLSTWADKVPPAVAKNGMFWRSSCPNIGRCSQKSGYEDERCFGYYYVPHPNNSWCQDADVCQNDCKNNPAPFSLILQTSCEEIATLSPKTIKKLCGIGIAKDCPELCSTTSCEEIATLSPKLMKELCDIGIAKDCPELCPGNKICSCTDFILPFSFNGKTTSCAEVAGFKAWKQKKLCNKKKIADNCPGVCICGTF